MDPKHSQYLAGFHKNHNTQHALLKIIETWHFILNKRNKVGAIVIHLSKVFDTLNHQLLLCKLKTCGFNTNTLTFIQSYFFNRYQRTKVGDGKNSIGVPQSFILGPLPFNVFIDDSLFLLKLLYFATMQMNKNDNIVISRLRHNFAINQNGFMNTAWILT